MQFGIKTKSDWKDANIKIELEEKDSPVVFNKEKAERNTGSNFIFDDNNRVNVDKLIMETPQTRFKKSENNDVFGWTILASAVLMELTSGVVIYRKKSKINL